MERYSHKYSITHNLWIREVIRFDDSHMVVSKWNDDSINLFLVERNKLLNFWKFILYKIKKTITKKRTPIYLLGLIILLISNSNVNSYSLPPLKESVKLITYYDMVQIRKEYIKSQDFTYDLFYEYLNLISIRNKNIVISQSILETNWFLSDIFLENNNLFGMKEPRIRKTTAIGTNRNHAIYKHWTCSVDDYKLWYRYVTRNKEYENYYDFLLAMGYAEDVYYIPKLRAIKNKLILNT